MKTKLSPLTDSMNRSFRTLVLAATLTFTLCVAGQVRLGEPQLSAKPADFPTYPLRASANGRYLVDQNGTPTLLVGDSPHSLFVNLSPHQADTYFANRASYGINAVWVEVLWHALSGGEMQESNLRPHCSEWRVTTFKNSLSK